MSSIVIGQWTKVLIVTIKRTDVRHYMTIFHGNRPPMTTRVDW